MRYSKPTIYDPAFLPNNIYSGVPSFLNLPVLEHREELKGMDVAVMGVPWEGGAQLGDILPAQNHPNQFAAHLFVTPAFCLILELILLII